MRPHLVAVRLLVALGLWAALLLPRAAAQSVVTDGTVGPKTTLMGPSYMIGASLGKVVGANLFQSFLKFGLASGESASFTGAEGTANIIARVTGGSSSNINGAITSALNLFLINPFGIVFGPGATVNVAGSFHASTAAYLKMSDGSIFSATNPQSSTFSAAPPAAFGFLNASPPAITIAGSTIAVQGTLGLVGGPVTITGGSLSAPGGTIHIASAAGTGEIPVDPASGPAATVMSYGPVAITAGAFLAVSGGSVFIRAGTLSVDASEITADNGGTGSDGEILLQADGQVTLSDGALVGTLATARGTGSNVVVEAASLAISSEASIRTGTSNAAAAGNISIDVAGNLAIETGGEIISSSMAVGNSGNVSVVVGGALTIDGVSETQPTGILSDANSIGQAGQVTVSAGSLTILSYGEISSGTFGAGNGGNVSVTVSGTLAINSASADLTGIAAQTNPGSIGAGGDITIIAGSIVLSGPGPQIAAQSFGSGNAGSISIAAGTLQILGGAGISTAGATLSGGNIAISVGDLLYLSAGEITTSSEGVASNGSNITIDPRSMVLSAGSAVEADAFGGQGGNIEISKAVYIASPDSTVTASSQKSISGTITIPGQLVGLNGVLVVLPGALLNAEAILRNSCATRRGSPQSSFVEAGRGGLPQDPDTVLPALYLAPRTAAPSPRVARPEVGGGFGTGLPALASCG